MHKRNEIERIIVHAAQSVGEDVPENMDLRIDLWEKIVSAIPAEHLEGVYTRAERERIKPGMRARMLTPQELVSYWPDYWADYQHKIAFDRAMQENQAAELEEGNGFLNYMQCNCKACLADTNKRKLAEMVGKVDILNIGPWQCDHEIAEL